MNGKSWLTYAVIAVGLTTAVSVLADEGYCELPSNLSKSEHCDTDTIDLEALECVAVYGGSLLHRENCCKDAIERLCSG